MDNIINHDHNYIAEEVIFEDLSAVVSLGCTGDTGATTTDYENDEIYEEHIECDMSASVKLHPKLFDKQGNEINDKQQLLEYVDKLERTVTYVEVLDPEMPRELSNNTEEYNMEIEEIVRGEKYVVNVYTDSKTIRFKKSFDVLRP